jgi:hypothetical protein
VKVFIPKREGFKATQELLPKENCQTHFMKPVLHLSQNQAKIPPKRRTIGQTP